MYNFEVFVLSIYITTPVESNISILFTAIPLTDNFNYSGPEHWTSSRLNFNDELDFIDDL